MVCFVQSGLNLARNLHPVLLNSASIDAVSQFLWVENRASFNCAHKRDIFRSETRNLKNVIFYYRYNIGHAYYCLILSILRID
jgi:hypothetical protein